MKKEDILQTLRYFLFLIVVLIAIHKILECKYYENELAETQTLLSQYKKKLHECDKAYTINNKNLDSITKEHYKCYDVSYRTLENVKKLRRFVKENR